VSGGAGSVGGRSRQALVAVLMAAALVATACVSDSSDQASDESGKNAKTYAGLEGRYAHYDVVAYEGSEMNTMIISYGFTDLDRVDGELQAHESFCFSEARTDQPIKVGLSDAATQAIKPVPVAVTVTTEKGRTRLVRPATPTGIGVRLEDPANDPLPTDPTDPRIADDDHDGHPGVTSRIEVSPELIGEIYLARREIFAYDVDAQPDGTLTGVVRDRSEQLIIDASDPIFKVGGQWTQHPDLRKSPIILKPVSRSWDCERLRTERPTLFPPTPSVDY